MTAPVIVTTPHAKESGNWYTRSGEQVLTVEGAKGQPVRPDLRHARKLGLLPGVTTIIGCADKPALTRWKQRQAIYAALTLPRKPEETEGSWIARIEEDMDATAQNAAADGTAIHAAIQSHYEGKPCAPGFEAHVEGVVNALALLRPDGFWATERVAVHPLGYGTKADLHCTDGWLVDFKSKDGDLNALQEMDTYDDHAEQLAATRAALGGDHRCAIMFVSRTHPGAAHLVEVKEHDLERGWDLFTALHRFWCVRSRYEPGWTP